MKVKIRRGISLLTAYLLILFVLTGCEAAEVVIEEPTISVSETGEVIFYMVEDFTGDRYSVEGLEQMAREEITSYNSSSAKSLGVVTLEEVKMSEETGTNAIITLKFESAAAYTAYTGLDLFYGTIEQAKASGYDLDVSLVSGKDASSIIGKSEILNMGSNHILIAEGNMQVISPKKIQYYSDNTALVTSSCVNSEVDSGLSYIIMK
ncbi:hypothetical protein LJC58_09200 [Lachnospiraceae bacterium OttesenSCG-928-D06]|nr:hypothetical protein [Lachnospiraceae bacterium OttesenSCG-928-D06]